MLSNKAKILLAILALFVGATTRNWAVEINYTVKTPGAVSLGIYDAKGRLVRTLQSGKKIKEPGANKLEWDGKDDLGNVMPPGEYTWKGLSANVGWEYQQMMGTAGKPPYASSEGLGGWGGVWGNVKDMAVDPDGKSLYILWNMEEGMPALLKVDPKGGIGKFVLWGAHNPPSWGNCQAVATDGEHVYVASNVEVDDPNQKGKKLLRSLIWRVRTDTGEFANTYPGNNSGLLLVGEMAMDSLPVRPLMWERYADPAKRFSDWFPRNLFGIAVDKENLYCSLREENKLVIFDKKDGRRKGEASIAGLAGLAVAPDGSLYGIAGGKVVKFSPEGKELGIVVKDGLEAPYDLCFDSQGRIYVSDQGVAMQVKVFKSDGKPAGVIGKAGGRAWSGAWAKLKPNLLFPTGPAVAADGTLYVGEDYAPKRVAIFRDGKLVDEWHGPRASGCGMVDIADEANPEYVYGMYHGSFNVIIRYKVDYVSKTHVLDAVWSIGDARDQTEIKRNAVYGITGLPGYGYVRHFQGKTFLFANSKVFRVEGYELIPCVALGTRMLKKGAYGVPWDETIELVTRSWKSRPPVFPNCVCFYVWRDRNGDWEAQEDEMDWSLPPGLDPNLNRTFATGGSGEAHNKWYRMTGGVPVGLFVDKQLNIYAAGWKIPCLGLDEKGSPIYSWSKAEWIPGKPMGKLPDPTKPSYVQDSASNLGLEPPADVPGAIYPGGREVNFWVDPDDGGYYFCADVEGKGKGINWASSGIFARIGKMTKDGQWIWLTGEKATGFVKPGQFYKPGHFTGIVNGCLFLTDWNGQMRIFDKDSGLYVGSLFSDAFKGVKPDENLIAVEFTEAHVYTHPKTGEVYSTAGDGMGLKIFRVKGLKDIQRFSGAVEIKAAAK